MIRKELKRLSRRELVDIIYQMKKKEQQLQEEIAALQEALQDKRIRLSVAGSIADAAVSIANVFSAAQTAADLYLQEIAYMKEETRKACNRMLEEAGHAGSNAEDDSDMQPSVSGARYPNGDFNTQQPDTLRNTGFYEDCIHGTEL